MKEWLLLSVVIAVMAACVAYYVGDKEMKKIEVKDGKDILSWAEDIEPSALEQAADAARMPYLVGHVALMPDVHAGYGVPIGTVMALDGLVVPNAVGVDIGCGMISRCFGNADYNTETLQEAVEVIKREVPTGFEVHKHPIYNHITEDMPRYLRDDDNARQRTLKSLGTLGGGNHFIELQRDTEGLLWATIHSGSRNAGLKIANHHHKIAEDLCSQWSARIPNKDLSFLTLNSREGQAYWTDMNWALRYAQANRDKMMEIVTDAIGYTIPDVDVGFKPINIHHNYASIEHHMGKNIVVHRKGAVLARKGTVGIIPGSQGTATYITEGLGNPASFNSSSHGAGRMMSRTRARKTLSLDTEQDKMRGIIHSMTRGDHLDEAPGAYKEIDIVMEEQKDLTEIVTKLTPLASIKG
jgi:tRNA-splicing ligase RtcB